MPDFHNFYYPGLSVERALFDIRRGLPFVADFAEEKKEFFIFADDTLSEQTRAIVEAQTSLYAIDGKIQDGAAHVVNGSEAVPPELIAAQEILLKFVKRAYLAPRLLIAPVFDEKLAERTARFPITELAEALNAAPRVERMIETPLPNKYSLNTKIFAYRSIPDLYEHYAVVIGDPTGEEPIDIRLHAECMTGDLLGSMRCDCGDQLHTAMTRFSEKERGILIYMRQEGRNIGLLNKLRAYHLQNQGADTVDANLALGFEEDERDYAVAGLILRDLGVKTVNMHTDNAHKLKAMGDAGITVTARRAITSEPHDLNRDYLDVKYNKMKRLPA